MVVPRCIRAVFLNGIDSLVPFTRPTTAFVPVNQLSDNLSWTHGNHTFQFGTDLFLIRNNHLSYLNSFSDVQTNVVYLNTGGIANTNSPLDPHNNKIPGTNNYYPQVDSNFGPNYDNAIGIVMGIFSEGDGIYNYARNGTRASPGPGDQPPLRHQ